MEDQISDIKVDEIVASIPPALNKYHSLLSMLYSLRYKLLIYKLIKRGHASISNVSKDAEISEVNIRNYIDDIEKLIQNEIRS